MGQVRSKLRPCVRDFLPAKWDVRRHGDHGDWWVFTATWKGRVAPAAKTWEQAIDSALRRLEQWHKRDAA